MIVHLVKYRRRYVAMGFRRFIRKLIIVACHVLRRSRRTTFPIIGWQPPVDRLFGIWAIRRAGFSWRHQPSAPARANNRHRSTTHPRQRCLRVPATRAAGAPTATSNHSADRNRTRYPDDMGRIQTEHDLPGTPTLARPSQRAALRLDLALADACGTVLDPERGTGALRLRRSAN